MYCWSIDYFTDYFSRYLQKSIYFGARLIYDLSWWRPLFNHPNAAVTIDPVALKMWFLECTTSKDSSATRKAERWTISDAGSAAAHSSDTVRHSAYWSTLFGKALHLGKSCRGSTDKFETEQQVFWDTANKKGMWKRNAKNGETTNQSFLQTSSEFWKCWICEQFLLISSQFTDVWYVNVANLEE
jgi:hypothetical protein